MPVPETSAAWFVWADHLRQYRVGLYPIADGQPAAYDVILRQNQRRNNESSSMTTQNQADVVMFKFHAEAEAAVKEPQHPGLDMKKLSLAGHDADEHVRGV